MWDFLMDVVVAVAREAAPEVAELAGRQVGGDLGGHVARKAAEALLKGDG